MPDWSYRTLFRPLLFRLPAAVARDLTLKTFGLLGSLPGGSFIIRTMGHMESSTSLESRLGTELIKYPVGLSGGLDIHCTAHKALSQIGFGFIEVGPITLQPVTNDRPILRDVEKEAIVYPDPFVNDGVEHFLQRLKRNRSRLPLMFRIRHTAGSTPNEAVEDIWNLCEKLSEFASGFYLDCIDEHWNLDEISNLFVSLVNRIRTQEGGKSVFLCIPLDYPSEKLEVLLHSIHSAQFDGYIIGEYVRTEQGYEVGRNGKWLSVEKLQSIRPHCKEEQVIISAGGVHQPQDALELINAGAQYIQLHSGFVYAGPGLPKRVNEAILYDKMQSEVRPVLPSFWKYWGWMCLLGIGMIIGGILAWIIAATRVMLPYDETFLGISVSELESVHPELLHFMSHDRITLAGTMLSIGVIYFLLAQQGLRYELHWAKTALMTSGVVGFSSFFLYLGYGYFDFLHALAAVILLPMFLLSMRNAGGRILKGQPNLFNDRRWLLAQWGQLMFVLLGISLAIGGLAISFVGITSVFVPEDLEFLKTTPDTLIQLNDRLLSLIAHDRAGFGGALLCDAIAILATALWGIQQGERWMWWMFLLGGLPGFVAVFYVHWGIGYTDFVHLLPAYIGVVMYVLGLVFLYPYLMGDHKRAHSTVKVSNRLK